MAGNWSANGSDARKEVPWHDTSRTRDNIVINTCGFIDNAKTESGKYDFGIYDIKRTRFGIKVLQQTGCLSEHYRRIWRKGCHRPIFSEHYRITFEGFRRRLYAWIVGRERWRDSKLRLFERLPKVATVRAVLLIPWCGLKHVANHWKLVKPGLAKSGVKIDSDCARFDVLRLIFIRNNLGRCSSIE
jgi:hypothetical protein